MAQSNPSSDDEAKAATLPFPTVQTIGFGAPFSWLAKGLSDLKSNPAASLFYGFCFAGMGLFVTFVFEHAYQYTSAATTGFLLMAPFFAMGLYELSRRRQQGLPSALAPTLTVWRRNAGNIAVFAGVLTVIFLIWARASLVVFAVFYTKELPNLSGFLSQVLSFENFEFLAVYFAVGLVFATLVFAVSVVSIPLMLDRNQDAITSMIASIRALALNTGPLLLWALLIVSLTILGFLSFHIGLVAIMPIVGHATWHAYRDLIAPLDQS